MVKKVSEIIPFEEYDTWYQKDCILINAPTGSGKSFFIHHAFYPKMNRPKILYLSNRVALRSQMLTEYGNNRIDYKNYQHFENSDSLSMNDYDYIVCDEAHYFMTDSAFNDKTFIWIGYTKLDRKDKVLLK